MLSCGSESWNPEREEREKRREKREKSSVSLAGAARESAAVVVSTTVSSRDGSY